MSKFLHTQGRKKGVQIVQELIEFAYTQFMIRYTVCATLRKYCWTWSFILFYFLLIYTDERHDLPRAGERGCKNVSTIYSNITHGIIADDILYKVKPLGCHTSAITCLKMGRCRCFSFFIFLPENFIKMTRHAAKSLQWSMSTRTMDN